MKFKAFCKSFVSLVWLDESINFAFRFVAKISEVLLAIGIVISAVDYLTHGRLMLNNLALANAWAWTQAIAIESSCGVVVLYALQAKKERDTLKAWLYAILALLLAIVGGVMLFTQIVYSSTGIDIALHTPIPLVVGIASARTIVSIAYIAMCRIKHVRLSGDEPTHASEIDIQSEVQHAITQSLQGLQQQLQDMQQQQFAIAIQEVKRTVIEEVTQAKLIAMPKQIDSQIDSHVQPDRLAIAIQALQENPTITDKELAKRARCSINTARKYKQLAKETV